MTDNTLDTTPDTTTDTSHAALDPNVMPNFEHMPNVATMDTSHIDKERPLLSW